MQLYKGIVEIPPEERAKSILCFIETKEIEQTSAPEKLLIYLEKDEASKNLKAGDLIIFKAKIDDIDESGNPGEFNYKKYLWNKGIKYTAYVNKKSWKLLTHNRIPFYQSVVFSIREKLNNMFLSLGLSGNELGVAKALTIGDKTQLDPEIKQAYISSGTMHILAVSGMHVMLMYCILDLLLSFLNNILYGRFLKLILILACIWFYAMLTGLAPSISRAAVMVTFLVTGQTFRRQINIFNPIAASALFLLILHPLDLLDVGFQLSYAAVISIVVFYPFIKDWINPGNLLYAKTWDIIAVTLAAQILTIPISLYYFSQFPNLFLLSNLVAIPLSTLIMYFSVALIGISDISWLAPLAGKIYGSLIWLLNKVVTFIESLPYALTKHIYLSFSDVILMYLCIIAASLFLIRKRASYLVTLLFFVLIMLSVNLWQKYTHLKKKEIVFYHEHKNTIVRFQNGNQSVWLIKERNKKLVDYIEKAKYSMLSEKNEVVDLDSLLKTTKHFDNGLWAKNGFFNFYGKRFLIADSINRIPISFMDYTLLLDEVPIKNIPGSSTIILNPVFPKSKASRIEQKLIKNQHSVYNMDKSGAFILKL